MKVFKTIGLAFITIISSLICLSASTCAAVAPIDIGTRIMGAIIAVVALAGAIAAVMEIAKLNRKQ